MMQVINRRLLLVVVGILLLLSMAWTPKTLAANTTYYINNISGSNCNNSGSGTTQTNPWCDFTPVNSRTFGSGDKILLARGATWTQAMTLRGSGAASNFIVVDAYGTGVKPIIRGNGNVSDRTIVIQNGSYWRVGNLELAYAGRGINLAYTTSGNEGIFIHNLYIHDINGNSDTDDSYGVVFTGDPAPDTTQYVVKNIDIFNVKIENVRGGIGFFIGPSGQGGSTLLPNNLQNATVRSSIIRNASRPGISMVNASHVHVLSTIMDRADYNYQPQGTTGNFFWQDTDFTFTNNMILNTPDSGSYDQSGADIETWVDGFKFRGNYIAENAGNGLEFFGFPGKVGDYNRNHEVSSNTFYNNSKAGKSPYLGSLLLWNDSGIPMTGQARDNLYYEPTGFVRNIGSSWTFSNNRPAAQSDVYNAANSFSTTQGANSWRYQYYNGSNYTDLTPYDSGNERWGTNGYIARFDTLTDTCASCWLARTWIASKTSTISIRGRVLKNDIDSGDGVRVRVTKNGQTIWPTNGAPQTLAYNDQVGYDTNLDDIPVVNGDIIRFEVGDGGAGNAIGDLTSWSPTVAYTLAPGNVLKVDDATIGSGNTPNAFNFSGSSWQRYSNLTDFFQNTVSLGYGAGDSVTIPFTGSQINLYCLRENDTGIMDVYLDNTKVATVDNYSATIRHGICWTSGALTNGPHTLKVIVTGIKNASSSQAWIHLDRVDIFTSPVTIIDNTVIGTGNNQFNFTGVDWQFYSNLAPIYKYYNDTTALGHVSNDSVSIAFNGTQISLYTLRQSDEGIMNIYIDNVKVATIDNYASFSGNELQWTSGGLPNGTHTLRVVVTGMKNNNSSQAYIQIDRVDVQ